MTLTLLTLLVTAACPLEFDDSDKEAADPTPCPLRTYKRSHGELSVGYLGQWADERNRGFELRSTSAPQELAGALTDPFLGAPYTGAVQAGPAVEWRGVFDQVRLTVGLRFPFTTFRPSDSTTVVNLGGAPREVLVRSVSSWDLRTGLGFELPFSRVTPFVDVLGDVTTLTTQLAIDGLEAKYRSTAFALGGRAGLRVQLSHVFVQLAGEAMLLGPARYGGTLQVGVAL